MQTFLYIVAAVLFTVGIGQIVKGLYLGIAKRRFLN